MSANEVLHRLVEGILIQYSVVFGITISTQAKLLITYTWSQVYILYGTKI